jgi:hypothetical protein
VSTRELKDLMKKIALLAAVVVAFSASAVMAGSCPGSGCGGGDKSKDKEGTKNGEKKSLTVEVAL